MCFLCFLFVFRFFNPIILFPIFFPQVILTLPFRCRLAFILFAVYVFSFFFILSSLLFSDSSGETTLPLCHRRKERASKRYHFTIIRRDAGFGCLDLSVLIHDGLFSSFCIITATSSLFMDRFDRFNRSCPPLPPLHTFQFSFIVNVNSMVLVVNGTKASPCISSASPTKTR